MTSWKIVIADDDDDVRRLLALAVRSFGHQTLEAIDGDDAVNQVMEHQPDVVFLDVLMPKLNGFDALARLRALGFSGKIVIITALTATNAAQLDAGEQPDAMLAKPFRRQEVGDCLLDLAAASPKPKSAVAD